MSRALVTKEMTREAARNVRDLGARPAMVKLSRLEPELIKHVNLGMSLIWRKLKSYGLITEKGMNGIDETLHPTILGVVISSLEAARSGHSALCARLQQDQHQRQTQQQSDGPCVSAELLEEIEMRIWPFGRDRAMRELHFIEPELKLFIARVYGCISDSMADREIPDSLQELLAEQFVIMGVICSLAARRTS